MVSVSLSVTELCFAILVESHTEVCQCLFDFTVHAVQDCYSNDWMDRLSAGLGKGLSEHMKLGLQNDLPQTDIYLVCKLLRFRINDIACWCGGKFLNPNMKERLCLQLQAVETARHWVFHGDQHVSPGEVRSSLFGLLNILTAFSSRWTKMSFVADNLSRLIQQAEKLASPNPVGEYSLYANTIVSTLVWTSLAELRSNFEEMFRDDNSSEIDEAGPSNSSQEKRAAGDFTSLFKTIRKAITERPRDEHSRQAFYMAACKNVQKARNTLAHNPPLTMSTANRVLQEISSLLEHFKLAKTQTTSALEKIKSVRSEKGECCVFRITSAHENNCLPTSNERERILRPKCDLFIGRQEDILSIESVLREEGQSRIQVVLIFGPAGVGKSYLATHATGLLFNVYNKQTWLSCSSVHELRQDMSCADISPNNNRPCQVQGSSVLCSVQSCVLVTQSSRLVVFDDVSSSTMHLILQLITENNNNRALITTRSNAVKLFLQKNIPLLHFVEVKPFSSAESWSLLSEKVSVADLATKGRASIDKILIGHLENLPLCVGIYSSWLACTTRKKRRKTSDDGHTADSIVNYESPCLNWGEVEESFGDRFHVRGLTGVVQATEGYLEDHPLVVLLLAKICIVDDKCIPWEVIGKSYRWTAYDIQPELNKLVNGVLGVTDWLFSESGQETLVLCRDALEELGLIRWECSTATIHVHGLTLQRMQKMLTANCLFLGYLTDTLFVWNEQIRDGRTASSARAEIVSRCVSQELLLQVICRGVVLLKQASVKEVSEEKTKEVRSYTLSFLLKLVQNSSLENFSGTTLLSSKSRFRGSRALLASSLFFYIYFLGIPLTSEGYMDLIKLYDDGSRDKAKLEEVKYFGHAMEGKKLESEGHTEQACKRYQQALAAYEDLFGCTSDTAMLFHSLTARCLDQKGGPTARKDYLIKAATKCPRLRTEPSPFLVGREILKLCIGGNAHKDVRFSIKLSKDNNRLEAWQILAELEVKDNFKDGRCIDEKIAETARLLITLSKERQRALIEKLSGEHHQQQYHCTSEIVSLCNLLIYEACRESLMCICCQKFSQALHGGVKAIRLVANKLRSFDEKQLMTAGLINRVTAVLEVLLDNCFFSAGHYSLPAKLLTEILENKKRKIFKAVGKDQPLETMNEVSGSQTITKVQGGCTSGNFEQMTQLTNWIELKLRVFNELQALYEKKDFQASLTGLVSCLEDIYDSADNTLLKNKELDETRLLVDIHVLCLYAEDLSRRQVAKTVHRLSRKHNKPPGSLLVALSCRIEEIDAPGHQPNFIETFADTRRLQATGDRLALWQASLKCWKLICESRFVEEMKEQRGSKLGSLCLRCVFVFEQAKTLQQLYTEEGRYNAAEWFAKFCFQFAKEMRWSVLASTYGLQYAQFLKETGQRSEAMEQCRLVYFDLVEDFGEDYLDWLPDMPKAAALLEDFQKETNTSLAD